MFKLVLPFALVITVIYVVTALWRGWKLRNAPARRTWALFAGRSPRDRLLRRRIQRADPTAIVATYRLGRDAGLAAQLGVTEEPTLVLGDGAGGVSVRLAGRDAIRLYLERRGDRGAEIPKR